MNAADRLVREVLFLVHDHLHVWATRVIRSLTPELGFGEAPITSDNFESMVFAMLLTEAAATVGLDYWYLSTVDLSRCHVLGTATRTMTVSYHEHDLEEYRLYSPDFEVQTPDFFGMLARFYCTGRFVGFDGVALRNSAKLFNWLGHELRYGALQRRYARQWIARLGGITLDARCDDWERPVGCDSPWQTRLINSLGELLWHKVKDGIPDAGVDDALARISGLGWRTPSGAVPDYRFVNLNVVPATAALVRNFGELPRASLRFACAQYVSQFEISTVPTEIRRVLGGLVERCDLGSLHSLLEPLEKIVPDPDEPLDLFLLN